MFHIHRLTVIFFIILFPFSGRGQYFQQDVKYVIRASLNDNRHELNCDIKIIYKNNSPDKLNEIYLHLWPAGYSDHTTKLAEQYYNAGDDRMLTAKETDFGNIDSLNFQINGEKAEWQTLPGQPDVCKLRLRNPLLPGDSLTISTPFRVDIPSMKMSRLGHFRQAYYITQWYPKPAVYDVKGWNYFSYIDKGEFYSEYGAFDVYITLPENYKVAATGILTDESELKWLQDQDSLTRMIKQFPVQDSFPPSSSKMKTLHFQQSAVHDFAWFADKRWHVMSDTMKLESGKIIQVHSFFNNNQHPHWLHATDIIKNAIAHYSEEVGEYPYSAFTAVDVFQADGANMEYPMITTIGKTASIKTFEQTLVHETGHSWFYGILGNNERCHPWMDEGINKYYEILYMSKKYPNDSTGAVLKFPGLKVIRNPNWRMPVDKKWWFNYLAAARANEDQPGELCSQHFNLRNYSQDVYHKTATGFKYLKIYLGDSLFNKCMKNYYEAWKFKHPAPSDLEEIFENISGKNLDWIFKDFLLTRNKIDYSISNVKLRNDSVIVKIKNKGNISAPLNLNSFRNDSLITRNWYDGFDKNKTVNLPGQVDKITIDSEEKMPEIYSNNNFSRTKGIFRKCGKTEFIFGTSLEEKEKNKIFYLPVVGYNFYNGFMAGAVFHNISFLEKRFEYRLMPLYAFRSADIAGGGDFEYHIYPNNNIYKITFRSGFSHYAFDDDYYSPLDESFIYEGKMHFSKFDTKVVLSVREKEESKRIKNEITLRHILINRDLNKYYYDPANITINYFQAEYLHQNQNPLERGLFRVTAIGNEEYIQVGSEIKKFFNYNTAKKGFEARAYAGYMNIYGKLDPGMEHRMSLSGRDGQDDYLFDEVFFMRSHPDNIQFTSDYAGFRAPTSFYRLAEKWMAGVNVSTTLPGLIPFRLFGSVGTFNDHPINDIEGNISWELGVDLPVIRDVFVISLPFAYSEDIKYVLKQTDREGIKAIRFELHLKKLNPLNFIKNYYR